MRPERFKTRDDSPKGERAHTFFWLGALLTLIAVAAVAAFGLWRERPEPIPVERGDLLGLISEIVDAMSERGSEEYVRPSSEERAEFAELASSMRAGDLEGALRAAKALDYTLVWYDDTATGGRLLMAREEADPAHEAGRGWGTIVVNPQGDDVLIEVPHPKFDLDTPEVGVELLRRTEAGVLLVAGAHRYSWDDKRSDVAHAPDTAFDAAHETLLPASFVVQPHGFHSDQEDRYPDVVLSGGVVPAPPGVEAIYRRMREAGIDVGLFDGGARFQDLAGTANIQGRSTRGSGGVFVHVELARGLREDAAERSEFAKALASALIRANRGRRQG